MENLVVLTSAAASPCSYTLLPALPGELHHTAHQGVAEPADCNHANDKVPYAAEGH